MEDKLKKERLKKPTHDGKSRKRKRKSKRKLNKKKICKNSR